MRRLRSGSPGASRVGHALAIVATVIAAGCTSEPDTTVPVRAAPPSRHEALVAALADDARAFAFEDGDWLEDRGDAPFYGLAWLSRRVASASLRGGESSSDAEAVTRRSAAARRASALLSGDPEEGDLHEKIMAALGVIQHVAASRDRALVAALDGFVDRLDAMLRASGDYLDVAERGAALRTFGPTAATALVALVEVEYAIFVGGPRAAERIDRALALDARIRALALTDLVDGATGRQARGYAFAPGQAGVFDLPNATMLLLKARLFRATRREEFRLEARATYVALRPLVVSEAPLRYASPCAAAELGAHPRELSTLATQNAVALALLALFEITGDLRFVDEADRIVDGIAEMRGPWCASDVHDARACAPACAEDQACVSRACTADRCTTGLLHHVLDGRLARPEDGVVFCAGCSFQTLYVAGYRRALADEPY